jgi:cytochrome b6-f complex iron-sulfur subunit
LDSKKADQKRRYGESAVGSDVERRKPSRRKFVIVGAGTAAAATYFFSQRKQWSEVGPPESVPRTGALNFTDRGRGVFLMRAAAGDIYALSQRCSHQGCDVEWKSGAGRFECPCHAGVYNANGDRVSGQPIRGLERLRTRINADGMLEVLV